MNRQVIQDNYGLRTPINSHRRPASCEEINCQHWREGWLIVLDLRTDKGLSHEYTIKHTAHKKYKQELLEDGRTLFTFEAGQVCLRVAQHTTSLERAPFSDINQRGVSNDEFIDTYNEQAYRLNVQISKG